MKKVHIITNYYPPETGAAANRIETLALGLKDLGHKVVVICPLPNYPKGRIFKKYRWRIYRSEEINGISVKRLWIYATVSKNKWKRLLAMLSFSISLFIYRLFHNISETVIIQTPPLLIANAAIRLLKSSKRKIILNVSDLWPKAGVDLGVLQEGRQLNSLERLERYNYEHSDLIVGQSNEILNHVQKCEVTKDILLYRNFPKIDAPVILDNTSVTTTIKIIYAGLLGVAQGILQLCKSLKLPQHIEFHIYGEGAERIEIEDYLESSSQQIRYLGVLSKEEVQLKYMQYDVALVPLVRRIEGSVPSKIFELAHFGLPIIYMSGGEGAEIVREFNLGQVIEPKDYDALNSEIKKLNKVDLKQQRELIREAAQNSFIVEPQIRTFSKIIET